MKLSSIMMAAATAACLGMASHAWAAPTVTYTLVYNDNESQVGMGTGNAIPGGNLGIGYWALYADDSAGDNAGIAAAGAVLTTPTGSAIGNSGLGFSGNVMPFTSYKKGTAAAIPAGLSDSRDDGTSKAGEITGSQHTTNLSAYIITGLGQANGTLNPPPTGFNDVGSVTGNVQETYTAHLLIAWGTYDGLNPTLPIPTNAPQFATGPSAIDTKANVLLLGTVAGVQTATVNTEAANIVVQTENLASTPEPASLGVMGLGVLSLLASRRRKA